MIAFVTLATKKSSLQLYQENDKPDAKTSTSVPHIKVFAVVPSTPIPTTWFKQNPSETARIYRAVTLAIASSAIVSMKLI